MKFPEKFITFMSFFRYLYCTLFFVVQILDLVPILAQLYFGKNLPLNLSRVQESILFCIGLQRQDVSYIEVRF